MFVVPALAGIDQFAPAYRNRPASGLMWKSAGTLSPKTTSAKLKYQRFFQRRV